MTKYVVDFVVSFLIEDYEIEVDVYPPGAALEVAVTEEIRQRLANNGISDATLSEMSCENIKWSLKEMK